MITLSRQKLGMCEYYYNVSMSLKLDNVRFLEEWIYLKPAIGSKQIRQVYVFINPLHKFLAKLEMNVKLFSITSKLNESILQKNIVISLNDEVELKWCSGGK